MAKRKIEGCSIMTGYLIEYQKQISFFFKKVPGDNFTEKRKALVSREMLAQMLSTYRFIIFAMYLVDMSQYKMNHDEPIEIIMEV